MRLIISLVFVILLTSIISAEIMINQQPIEIYNLGDSITIPVTIKTTNLASGLFQMDLLCDGQQVNFYKNGIKLSAGEEKDLESSLILTEDMIKNLKGDCKVKAIFLGDYVLTNEFKISDLINIQLDTKKTDFNPEESMLIEGKAIKENMGEVNGFIELELVSDDASKSITQLGTINKGFFSINILLPKNVKAGTYSLKLNAYEKDSEEHITNNGLFTGYTILIKQIPTNLEIIFENQEINPGENLKVKAVLHDQTGEKIGSNAIISIKNSDSKILEQIEKPTDEFLEYPIAYNEPPAEWKVVAASNKLTAESIFKIKEKQDIKVTLINKTLILTNIGNVPYNKTLLVKIGNTTINLDTKNLGVDKTEKYTLVAPEGKYSIEVYDTNNENKLKEMVVLAGGEEIGVFPATGYAVSKGVIKLVRHPLAWFFIIGILGFIAFMTVKKGYRKSFIGYVNKKEQDKTAETGGVFLRKKSIIKTNNKAELSLSIKGEKQDVSLICLKIKNLAEIESKKGNAEETLQKIVNIAEEKKAVTYEDQNNLFFILIPIKTKTFKNERNAVDIAQKIKEILTNHNKMFKQRIETGVSLNYGTAIVKQEKDSMKFMSLGTLITTAKKIASISEGEIYLSDKIKDKLGSEVRGEKIEKDNMTVYTIKQINDSEDNKKFIKSFLNRVDKQ